MLRILPFALLASGLVTTTSFAQETQQQVNDDPLGEISLSNETLQLRYIDDGDGVIDGSNASFGFFLSEERDIVLDADLLMPAGLNSDRFQIKFGPRAYAALLEDENDDVFAVSLGAEIRFEIDRDSGFALVAQGFYAPDILTFGTANNLTDLSARLETRLQSRLTIFGGMRWFEFDLTEGGGTRTLQEELFAGVGWRFD